MDALGRDARFALRSLRKDWMVNLLAAVSLALALAGNATVFSLINTLLYRPLPYPEPERIVLVGEREANAPQTLTAAPANLRDLRERNRSFEQLAGFRFGAVALGIDDKPISVQSATVTADFFDVLGATAAQGRGFLPEEGIAGNHRVVVISAAFAQEHLSEYPSPTGTEVMLNGEPHTVVGVMPDDFQFFFPGVRAWVPLTLEPTGISRDERSIIGVGRMRPGVTMEQLRDDMGRVWDELVAEYPESNRGWGSTSSTSATRFRTHRHASCLPCCRGLFFACCSSPASTSPTCSRPVASSASERLRCAPSSARVTVSSCANSWWKAPSCRCSRE